MKIVNFGSLNIDHVYQVPRFVLPGETLKSKSYQRYCGGKGLNQSIALARAGTRVVHAGRIGSDGIFLSERLRQEGVEVDLVISDDAPTGHAIIQVNPQGENCILIEGGANQRIDSQQIEQVLNSLDSGDWLLLQNEINSIGSIVTAAHHRNIFIALNPAPITDEIRKIPLYLLDMLFINEIEGVQLTGEQNPEAILDWLLRANAKLKVVLSLGEKGAIYADSQGKIQHSGFRVTAVDTTAAGDTFIGFFLSAIAKSVKPEQALSIACRAASICVTRLGAADSIPSMETVRSQ
jgi:ribokinase